MTFTKKDKCIDKHCRQRL